MMKKSGVLALLLLYIVTVNGFAINLHFCFSELTSFTVNLPVQSCTMLKPAGKMKCCQDHKISVKIKEAHQGETQSGLAKLRFYDLPRQLFTAHCYVLPRFLLEANFGHAPPGITFTDQRLTFIKNRVFLI